MRYCKILRTIRKNLGLIISSIGLGIVLTFLLPVWIWILAVGGGLIYLGWFIMNCFKH